MKWFLVLFFALSGAIARGQSTDSLLRAALAADQNVRMELIRVLSQQPVDVDSLTTVSLRMRQVDAGNQRVVFSLLDEQGWPEGLSPEANHAIGIILDHADATDLQRYLGLLATQADRGVIDKSLYATILDRAMMHRGMRQCYGTQTVVRQVINNRAGVKTGDCLVWPVEQAVELDSLRATVGLPPMDEYVKAVERAYGMKCVWDPALGVDDMPVKYPQAGE